MQTQVATKKRTPIPSRRSHLLKDTHDTEAQPLDVGHPLLGGDAGGDGVGPPPAELTPFAFAGRLRNFLEKARVAVQVHLTHLEKAQRDDPLARVVLPELERIEEIIEKNIQRWASKHPVWTTWAVEVKGCGTMVLGAVMSRVDITRITTISKMWAHFGFAPGQKRTAGEKLDYDAIGRTWCWRLGHQLLMAKGKYYATYLERYDYEAKRVIANGGRLVAMPPHTDLAKHQARWGVDSILKGKKGQAVEGDDMALGQIHGRAMRYMIKAFLACLTITWREAEGLPLGAPYIIGREDGQGVLHTHQYQPKDYVG